MVLQDVADGVSRDAGRAARLYRLVITNTGTQRVSLAMLVQNGDKGLERDTVQAVMLSRQAIDGSHTGAQDLVDHFLDEHGRGIVEDCTRVTRLL